MNNTIGELELENLRSEVLRTKSIGNSSLLDTHPKYNGGEIKTGTCTKLKSERSIKVFVLMTFQTMGQVSRWGNRPD